ncbi:glycosyltransferase [Wenzhouxiangella sp. EGI_FJ10305]|uniref:glycosyltransferase n=1 Tax=Wenzhouxiangella sp. EGI_FJ10305 TaxID=3243768 RepID=UPI0035D6F882
MARILFVTSRLPYPPSEGHQLRAWHLLRAAARDHRVTLLSLRRPDEQPLPEHLPGIDLDGVHQIDLPALGLPHRVAGLALRGLLPGRTLLDLRYRPPALQQRFDQLVHQADLVHLDILAVAGLLERVPDGIPTILNEHNVESLLAHKRVAMETQPLKRLLLRLKHRGLERFERSACTRASRVLACSQEDAGRLQALAPGCRVDIVPNGVDLEAFRPGSPEDEQPGALVFVGHMGWFPNRDGVEYFIAEILPLLGNRKGLHLEIIGRNQNHSVPRAAAGRVSFSGFVDDLQARVQRAAVFIVPLRAGSGTRLKILEAMALGKAIVSTRIGAEGIGLVDGDSACLADTPAEFARAIDRLLDDPELRRNLGQRARQLAEQRYGWTVIGERLLAAYESLLQAQPDGSVDSKHRKEGRPHGRAHGNTEQEPGEQQQC